MKIEKIISWIFNPYLLIWKPIIIYRKKQAFKKSAELQRRTGKAICISQNGWNFIVRVGY